MLEVDISANDGLIRYNITIHFTFNDLIFFNGQCFLHTGAMFPFSRINNICISWNWKNGNWCSNLQNLIESKSCYLILDTTIHFLFDKSNPINQTMISISML